MFWLAKLAGYDYEIQYKKGNDNYVADALPRLPRQQIMHMVLDTSSSEFLQKIEKIWEQDADLHALMSHLTWKGGNLGHYTWDGQLLRKKGKLVVGNDAELRQQLLEWLDINNLSFCWEHHQHLFSQFLNDICVELVVDPMPIHNC